MRILLFCLAVLTAATLQAQTLTVVEVPAEGEYYLKVDAAGGVTIRPLRLIRVGQPQPPDQPPGSPSPFELEVKRRTQTVLDNGGTKTTAVGIASVYSLVGDGVASGSIGLDQWEDLLKAATTAVLNKRPDDAAKWTKFCTDLGTAVDQFKRDGRLDTATRVAAMLHAAADGINGAAGFTGTPASVSRLKDTDGKADGILDGIDLAQIIELVRLIMDLIKLLSGDG
jgi:hypothetical protein